MFVEESEQTKRGQQHERNEPKCLSERKAALCVLEREKANVGGCSLLNLNQLWVFKELSL